MKGGLIRFQSHVQSDDGLYHKALTPSVKFCFPQNAMNVVHKIFTRSYCVYSKARNLLKPSIYSLFP